MRKNIILITFLFFTTFLSLAQRVSTSKKKVLGVRAGVAPSFSNDKFDYIVNISKEKGKNFVAFGPIFGERLKMSYDYINATYPIIYPSYNKISLNGLNFVFQRNPNPKAKRFDFYFQYLFNFYYHTDRGKEDAVVFINKIYPYNLSYSSRKLAFSNTIGYGFKCKIFPNFYLSNDIGLGAGYSNISINYEDPKFDKNQKFFSPTLGLNLGLEYRFDKKYK